MAPESPLNEPVISGPFSLFEGSFILEYLEPHPSRDVEVLIRATYKHNHPFCKQSKGHPQKPPLHLHFNHAETFEVLQGQIEMEEGYSLTKTVYAQKDGPHIVTPWTPHTFNPVPNSPEDTILLVSAERSNNNDIMDRVFFTNLLRYASDVYEKKVSISPFQIMLLNHVSGTAMVSFPSATWLGALRWWLPYRMQATFASVGRLMGLTPMMKKYTSDEEFAEFERAKRT